MEVDSVRIFNVGNVVPLSSEGEKGLVCRKQKESAPFV